MKEDQLVTRKKYRIDEILDQLPYQERKQKMKELLERLSISPTHLWVIRNYKETQTNCINSDQLCIIADTLSTTVDYLMGREEFIGFNNQI